MKHGTIKVLIGVGVVAQVVMWACIMYLAYLGIQWAESHQVFERIGFALERALPAPQKAHP